jgi:hypothetical protein
MSCNKNCRNQAFPSETVKAVWLKRTKGHPWGSNWGYDAYGNSIKKEDYGDTKSQWGWDIDHSKPKVKNGTDHINNLQPLQTYHNRVVKSDNYPWSYEQHQARLRQLQRK